MSVHHWNSLTAATSKFQRERPETKAQVQGGPPRHSASSGVQGIWKVHHDLSTLSFNAVRISLNSNGLVSQLLLCFSVSSVLMILQGAPVRYVLLVALYVMTPLLN